MIPYGIEKVRTDCIRKIQCRSILDDKLTDACNSPGRIDGRSGRQSFISSTCQCSIEMDGRRCKGVCDIYNGGSVDYEITASRYITTCSQGLCGAEYKYPCVVEYTAMGAHSIEVQYSIGDIHNTRIRIIKISTSSALSIIINEDIGIRILGYKSVVDQVGATKKTTTGSAHH